MRTSHPLALPNMPQQLDVSIYSPNAPLNSPDTSSPARAAAVHLENLIRSDVVETGAFFDINGRLIVRKAGTVNHVRFDAHELAGVAGTLFTHNHPDGLPLSRQDVEQAVSLGLIELRAVTTYCRYIMYPDTKWPVWTAIERSLLQHLPAAQQLLTALAQSCYISRSDAAKEMMHQLWIMVSHDHNLHYMREPS